VYVIGIDLGTLSGRALLVNAGTGEEIASSVYLYPDGVIDKRLPDSDILLPPDWALQNSADYLVTIQHTVRALLIESQVDRREITGLGIAVTSSTMMPVTADGTPLSSLAVYRNNPHAWVKLWKHHGAEKQAQRIAAVAAQQRVAWLGRYGGTVSPEWFFSKALQILEEAPEIYRAADRLIEVGDWVIWQLTGQEVRSAAMAGYKAFYQEDSFPSEAFFAALHPDFAHIVSDKLKSRFAELGSRAGNLTPAMAALIGLTEHTAVAVANIDAHVTAPAVRATEPGTLVLVMGTSTCHIISDTHDHTVEGIFGIVKDGIVPGLYGYEAGQSSVGDTFAWFIDNLVPDSYFQHAQNTGLSIYEYLEQIASEQSIGEHGLIALDWWNGNRSTLMNTNLTGLLLGMSLATRAPDIYRALIEATAFGTRQIIETYVESGIEIRNVIAAGGLAERNTLLLQIYADVIGRDIRLAGSSQSPALGAAIHGAVAADLYPNVHAAAHIMGKISERIIHPNPEHVDLYQPLYKLYTELYQHFGKQIPDLMAQLKQIRHRSFSTKSV